MKTTRTVVLTGATSGVGLGMARGLAEQGARLVLCVRSLERGERLASELPTEVALVRCDLSSQQSIREAADQILAEHPDIDVLANVAGVLPPARTTSVDGIELVWATNFLGPFLLTRLLLPRLGQGARIVNISGETHRRATLNLDDPELHEGWSVWRAATQAALAKVVWTLALAEELRDAGVAAHTFCPGFVRSQLTRDLPFYARPVARLAMLFAQSEEKGARGAVHLATSPELSGVTGVYLHKLRRKEPAPITRDPELQRRLIALASR